MKVCVRVLLRTAQQHSPQLEGPLQSCPCSPTDRCPSLVNPCKAAEPKGVCWVWQHLSEVAGRQPGCTIDICAPRSSEVQFRVPSLPFTLQYSWDAGEAAEGATGLRSPVSSWAEQGLEPRAPCCRAARSPPPSPGLTGGGPAACRSLSLERGPSSRDKQAASPAAPPAALPVRSCLCVS